MNVIDTKNNGFEESLSDFAKYNFSEYMTFKPGDLVTLRKMNVSSRRRIDKIFIYSGPDTYVDDLDGRPARIGSWEPGEIGTILENVCIKTGQIEILFKGTVAWVDFEFLKHLSSEEK